MTNVTGVDMGSITVIFINGRNELLQTVDVWFFSAAYAAQLLREFLAQHGLTNAPSREVDRYCDEHEISPPDPQRIMLPTISTGQTIKITGTVSAGWTGGVVLSGLTIG